MRSIRLLIIALALGACAKGTTAEAFRMDADDQQHDAPASHDDSSLPIDAPKPPIDSPAPPIDAPMPGPDASDIGNDCFFNSQCPDANTCCFFGKCAVGVAGANNTCIP